MTLAALVPALVDGGGARLLDDAAYAAGVWRGMVRWRTLRPLLPELVSWPGRRPFTAASRGRRCGGYVRPVTLRLRVDSLRWNAQVDDVAAAFVHSSRS